MTKDPRGEGGEDVPVDAFSRLLGRLPSGDERERLRQARDALGIRPDDALWTVLLALQWHLVLYRDVPRLIERAAARATRQVVATADLPPGARALPAARWVTALACLASGFVIGFAVSSWYH